jgi:hypothetical protein
MMHRVLAPTLLFGALACGGGPERATGTAPTRLDVVTALDLDLDAGDSSHIGRLTHATRLGDGTLALLDAEAQQVVVLDTAGTVLRRIGRPGAGPGEFETPTWVGRCVADSLFVWDWTHRRIAVFGPDGTYARQFTPAIASPLQLSCNGRGIFAAMDASAVPFSPPRAGEDPPDLRGPLVMFDATGDTVAGIPGLPLGQSRVLGPIAAVAVRNTDVIVGISSSVVLRRFDFLGRELAHDSLHLEPRPMPDSLYEAELDRLSGATGATGPMRDRIREMLAAPPMPATLPLYQAMFTSPDESVWLVLSTRVEARTEVLGRDRAGNEYALDLPAGVELFEFGDDYALGKLTSEDGSERLVVYRFSR